MDKKKKKTDEIMDEVLTGDETSVVKKNKPEETKKPAKTKPSAKANTKTATKVDPVEEERVFFKIAEFTSKDQIGKNTVIHN